MGARDLVGLLVGDLLGLPVLDRGRPHVDVRFRDPHAVDGGAGGVLIDHERRHVPDGLADLHPGIHRVDDKAELLFVARGHVPVGLLVLRGHLAVLHHEERDVVDQALGFARDDLLEFFVEIVGERVCDGVQDILAPARRELGPGLGDGLALRVLLFPDQDLEVLDLAGVDLDRNAVDAGLLEALFEILPDLGFPIGCFLFCGRSWFLGRNFGMESILERL